MTCTVDASVFVAAARETEEYYIISREFLRQVRAQAVTLICPTLVLPECAAAIARPTNDSVLASDLVLLIEHWAGLQWVALDLPLARRAVKVASEHCLRGADSVYVAVAEAFQATLVTWDGEMLQRGKAIVPTLTPAEWLKQSIAAG